MLDAVIALGLVGCLGIFVYAKRHPAVAERWSRMNPPTCHRCQQPRENHGNSLLCTACETDDVAEINPYA